MSDKSLAKTVMGWFIETPPEASPVEDSQTEALLARYADAEPVGVELKGEIPQVQGQALDFGKLYVSAGIDEAAQERVTKAQDLLKSLPEETPLTVKRQIVEASFKAFGYPIRELIEAGVGEIETLESYIQHVSRQTTSTQADAVARIDALKKQIAEIENAVTQSKEELVVATRLCNEQKLSIQKVLEFFGVDEVEKVVNESPRLHAPVQK